MSWAKVMKINSDMSEPLNFMHYIEDIAENGHDSYVLDPNNAKLWNELTLKSTHLYGYKAIRPIIYEHFSDSILDSLFNVSNKLGTQLNNFHDTTVFASGNIQNVIVNMTIENYNLLEQKFMYAYSRYCTALFNSENVGQMINDVFGDDFFLNYNTAIGIIGNTQAWNHVLQNEPLLIAMTASTDVLNYLCTSAQRQLIAGITTVGQNAVAVKVMANYPNLINTIVNNKEIFGAIASSQSALETCLEVPKFAEAILNSENAMNTIADSITAIGILCNYFEDIQISKNSLEEVYESLKNIKDNADDIYKDETLTDSLLQAKQEVEEALAEIEMATDTANLTLTAINQILTNKAFCLKVASNENIMKSIAQDSTMINAFINTEVKTGIEAFVETQSALKILTNYEVSANVIAANQVFLQEVLNSDKKGENGNLQAETAFVGDAAIIRAALLLQNKTNIPEMFAQDSTMAEKIVADDLWIKAMIAEANEGRPEWLNAFINNAESMTALANYNVEGEKNDALEFILTPNNNTEISEDILFNSKEVALPILINSDIIEATPAMLKILNDVSIMKKIIEDAEWMEAISNNTAWLDNLFLNEGSMEAIADSENAMTKFANSVVSVQAILNSEIAIKKVVENTTNAMPIVLASTTIAMPLIIEHSEMMTEISKNETWMNTIFGEPGNIDWIKAIVNNKNSLSIILNNEAFENAMINSAAVRAEVMKITDLELIAMILADESYLYLIANSPEWMELIANNSTWLDYICANEAVLLEFLRYDTAVTAFLNSVDIAKPKLLKVMDSLLKSENFLEEVVKNIGWMETICVDSSLLGKMINSNLAVSKMTQSAIVGEVIGRYDLAISLCLTNDDSIVANDFLNSAIIVTELAKNPNAMLKIAGDISAMNILANNTAILNILTQYETAYSSIHSKAVALDAILSRPTAIDAYFSKEAVIKNFVTKEAAMEYVANHSTYATTVLSNSKLSAEIVISETAMNAFATSSNGRTAIESNETIKGVVMNSQLGATKMIAGYAGASLNQIKNYSKLEVLFTDINMASSIINSNSARSILLNYQLPASEWVNYEPIINAFLININYLEELANSTIAMTEVADSNLAMGIFATNKSAMQEMADSQIAMGILTISSIARDKVLSTSTGIGTFATSSNAMSYIAKSKLWMDAIVANSTAMEEIAKSEVAMRAILNQPNIAELSVISDTTGTARNYIVANKNNIAMPLIINDESMMEKIAGNTTWSQVLANNSSWMDAIAGNMNAISKMVGNDISEIALINNTTVALKEILENTSVAMNVVLTDTSMLEKIGNNVTWREAVVNNPNWMNAIANTKEILETALSTTSFENTIIANKDVALPAIIASTTVAMNICLNDSTFMDKAMADEDWVYAIVNNPTWFAKLLESNAAIESMSKSALAMGIIADSKSAMEQIVQIPKAYQTFNGSTIALKAILDSGVASPIYLKGDPLTDLIENPIGIDFVVNNIVYLLNFLSNDTARTQLFNSPIGMLATAQSSLAMSTIVSTAGYVTELKTYENSYKIINGQNVALNAILSNPTATLNYLTGNALADLVQNEVGMHYIANNNSYIVTLLLNPTARAAMDTSEVVTNAINNSSYAIDCIFANANAVISFFKDNLLASVITSTYAMNHICNTKDYINIMLLNATARAAMDNAPIVQKAINTSNYALNSILLDERATRTFLTGGLLNAMAASYDAMKYISGVENHLQTVFSNDTAMPVIINTIASMDEIGMAKLSSRDVVYYHGYLGNLMNVDMAAAKFIAGYAGLDVYKIPNLFILMASASNVEAILANDQAFDLCVHFLTASHAFAASISAVTTLIKPEYIDRLAQAVENYPFMTAIAQSQTAMTPIAQDRNAMAVISTTHTAMKAIAEQEIGMAGIIGNTVSLGIIVQEEIARDEIIVQEVGLNAMIDNDSSWEAIKNNDFWIDAILANEIASGIFFRNPRAWQLILSSSLLQQRIAANQEAMYALLAADAAHHTDIVNTATFWTAFVNNINIFINALIWKTNIDNCISHSDFWNKIWSYTNLANGIASDTTAMTAIAASSTAMTAIAASSVAMTAIAASTTAMTAIAASSIAGSACGASSLAAEIIVNSLEFTKLTTTGNFMDGAISSPAGFTALGYTLVNGGTITPSNGAKYFARNGTKFNYAYAGSIRNNTFCPGSYKLEVYGARGGVNTTYGGKGGYSVGIYSPSSPTLLYIVTGNTTTNTAGGYNGGGTGNNYGGGGGATHIALQSGLLNTLSSVYTTKLLIVAGGGGGYSAFGDTLKGGAGGGTSGGNGTYSTSYYANNQYGGGGTQTSCPRGYGLGSFGVGGNSSTYGGGGGGGLYGGGAGSYSASGGGGSGYINTSFLTSYSMTNGSNNDAGKAIITKIA